MNTIRCCFPDCPSEFKTEEPLSKNATFMCRLHSPKEQKVFFQEYQFDKNMKKAHLPEGTSHIKFQGSRIYTPPEPHEIEESEDE